MSLKEKVEFPVGYTAVEEAYSLKEVLTLPNVATLQSCHMVDVGWLCRHLAALNLKCEPRVSFLNNCISGACTL